MNSWTNAEATEITVAELQAMMADGDPLIILDTSTPSHFAAGHIPGSVNVDSADVATWAAAVSKWRRICVVWT